MARVKINTRILDKATGEIHEPSNDFVDVSEQFAERIKQLQESDPRHKDSFEFEKSERVSRKDKKQDD